MTLLPVGQATVGCAMVELALGRRGRCGEFLQDNRHAGGKPTSLRVQSRRVHFTNVGVVDGSHTSLAVATSSFMSDHGLAPGMSRWPNIAALP